MVRRRRRATLRLRGAGRTTSTGHGAECWTRWAVLPSSTVSLSPRLPLATTTRPASTVRAALMISLAGEPLRDSLAAISVGVVGGEPMLDLAYTEDSTADTDMNLVMTGSGSLIEIQGTAEGAPFDRDLLNRLLNLGEKGCAELTRLQQEALAR